MSEIVYLHETVETPPIKEIQIPGRETASDKRELRARYTDLRNSPAASERDDFDPPWVNFCVKMGSDAIYGVNISTGEDLDALIKTLQEFQERAKEKR